MGQCVVEINKKEVNASKTNSPPGKFAGRAKQRSRFLARDVIYTSRAYAKLTMSVSVCLSVCYVTEVNWRIIANLGFKFRSTFTAHCGRSACRKEGRDHRREEWGIISRYASQCYTLFVSYRIYFRSIQYIQYKFTDIN